MTIATRAPQTPARPTRPRRTVTAQPPTEALPPMPAILEARDLTKSLPARARRPSRRCAASRSRVQRRRVRRPDGPVGLGQVDAPPGPRRSRPADQPARSILEGADDQPAVRRRGHAAAPRPDRLRLPVVQPDPAARRHRERRPAVHDRRRGPDAAASSRERIRDVIALVDLTGKEHHKPDQLSAGEQQRVAIARALVTRPALLFADEPTGNLDYTTGTEILDALWRSCVERGQTVVLVTHDSKAAAYADRVLVIGDGRIRDDHRPRPARRPRRGAAHRPPRPARPVGPMRVSLNRLACRSLARPAAARRPERSLGVALGVARPVRRRWRPTPASRPSIDRHRPRPRRPGRPARRRVRRDGPVRRRRVAAIAETPGRRGRGPGPRAPDLPRPRPSTRRRRSPPPVTVLGIDPAADRQLHDLPLVAGARARRAGGVERAHHRAARRRGRAGGRLDRHDPGRRRRPGRLTGRRHPRRRRPVRPAPSAGRSSSRSGPRRPSSARRRQPRRHRSRRGRHPRPRSARRSRSR